MDSHAVVHSHADGEEEDHHEKKSVMKKVKEKAKKMKETMKGHHHGHEEDDTPDDHDLDEEDDEEVDDPEVPGAPSRRTDAPVQGDILKVPMRNFGDTRAGRDENDPIVPRERTNANVSDPVRSNVPGLHGTTDHGAKPVLKHEEPKGMFDATGGGTGIPPVSSFPHDVKDNSTAMDVDTGKTSGPRQVGNLGQTGDNLGKTDVLGEKTPVPHKNVDPSHDQFAPEKPMNQSSSYTEKISSATSAISDKAISAKNAVASKLGYNTAGKPVSSQSQHQNQVLDPSTNQSKPAETPQVRGTMEPEHNTGTDLKPSNQTGGTYTEKISSATSAIADRAISAKNVVASKLGYGPSDHVHEGKDVTHTNVPTGTTAADQPGKTITSTVGEKLAPVYGKVAGAGAAVKSKIPGVSSASTDRGANAGAVGQARQDKGVSMKDYFAEKLKPGEEDKALSKVISEKLQKQKPGVKEQDGSARPMGKVTESEEVRQRLGTDEGNENFMVERIKASVGSTLGGTNQSDEGQ